MNFINFPIFALMKSFSTSSNPKNQLDVQVAIKVIADNKIKKTKEEFIQCFNNKEMISGNTKTCKDFRNTPFIQYE